MDPSQKLTPKVRESEMAKTQVTKMTGNELIDIKINEKWINVKNLKVH